ncbi:MAG TPA: fatty acid desaturase [Gemmataceae bacterium]|nr:fatty acid desaturase [Gemmataceae bacterium]
MASVTLLPRREEIRSPEIIRQVNVLRRPDNVTNWFYLAREYLFVASVIGLTIAFYHYRATWGIPAAWNILVTLAAIVLIGAGQHRLTTLGHEASHYMLFRHRLLNELTSDLLCMFPVWSTTHHYRIQHLAHHQFPNDPERDPDVTQMEASGHRFRFPMSPREFVWRCVVKQALWLPSLVRYIRMRARYAATGGGSGPYESKGPRTKLLVLVGLLYIATVAGVLTWLVHVENTTLLIWLPPALLAAIGTFYVLVPERLYRHTALKPDVPPRWQTLLRMTYLTALFTGLAWLSVWTGEPWGLYYVLLWIVPLATAFAFFMLMRQVVQHGNAGRDRFGNTRIFEVGRLIRFAVFPLGMDYHLPHHLFPMVPHYRLPALHALLMETDEYREHACMVEGYFWHRRPPAHATVLELMAKD